MRTECFSLCERERGRFAVDSAMAKFVFVAVASFYLMSYSLVHASLGSCREASLCCSGRDVSSIKRRQLSHLPFLPSKEKSN